LSDKSFISRLSVPELRKEPGELDPKIVIETCLFTQTTVPLDTPFTVILTDKGSSGSDPAYIQFPGLVHAASQKQTSKNVRGLTKFKKIVPN
jgi:hypothetical protein